MEKDVHRLLYEDAIKNLLNENDLLFLRFLLVEKAGLNLRHEIAHCLMTSGQYDPGLAHLLFIALLRLSQFDVTPKQAETPGTPPGSGSEA